MKRIVMHVCRVIMIIDDLIPFGFSFFYVILGIVLILVYIYDASFPGAPLLAAACFLVSFYTFRYTNIRYLFSISPFFWDVFGVMQTFFIPLVFITLIRAMFTSRKAPVLKIPWLVNIGFALLAPILAFLLLFLGGHSGFDSVFKFSLIVRIIFQFTVMGSMACVVIFLISKRVEGDNQAPFILAGFVFLVLSTISSFLGAAGIWLWKFTSHLHSGLFVFVIAFVLSGFIRFNSLLKVYKEQLELYKQNKRTEISGAEYNLSPREIEVVEQVFSGGTNREIAENLFISERTVKAHLSRIFSKCGVSNKLELVFLLSPESREFV